MSFNIVEKFENKIAEFYGADYAIAVDCCTHGLELCLRYTKTKSYTIPKRTYISVPFLASKLGIEFEWRDENWSDYYFLGNTNIIDAAVLWKKDSYISNKLTINEDETFQNTSIPEINKYDKKRYILTTSNPYIFFTFHKFFMGLELIIKV